jgi:hypothetical protein
VDELPSVMWAAARVGQALEASNASNSSSNRESGREQESYTGSAQDAATIQVQQSPPFGTSGHDIAHMLDVCITEASAVMGGERGCYNAPILDAWLKGVYAHASASCCIRH